MIGDDKKKWIIVVISFLIEMFVFATCMSCMGVYIKPVTDALNISRAAFSMVTTIESLVMMISGLIIGKAVGKYSVKLLMGFATLACGICLLIFSISPSIAWFYLSAALMGAAVAFSCNVPISYIIKNWFDGKNQGIALGIAFVGSGAGAMVLTPMYTQIIENYGWRISFAVAGVCVLLLVPLVFLFIGDKQEKVKGTRDNRKTDLINSRAEEKIMLGDALKMPATWIIFIGFMFVTFSNLAVLNHGVPFMTDNGIDPSRAALIISLASGILIVGKIVIGRVYDKLGTRKTTILEVILIVLCIASFLVGAKTGLIVIIGLFAIFYGFGYPISSVGLPLVVGYMYEKSDYGAILGFYSMAVGIAGMLQIVVSLIYDMTGSYYPSWIGMVVMCTIAIGLFKIKLIPQSKQLFEHRKRD